MFHFNAADLRARPTMYEHLLWKFLRARRMVGLKFRRQHPLGPFIVDFVCLSHKIVIELDGPVHEKQKGYDQKRDQWLEMQGFSVLRIKNERLENNRFEVLSEIRAYLLSRIGL
jgi:very-short-patch-repair endonuclease